VRFRTVGAGTLEAARLEDEVKRQLKAAAARHKAGD
jgi:hypothetical protein